MTIRRKLILWIAGPTLAIYVLVLGVSFAQLIRRNREIVERDTAQLATHYANRFNDLLSGAAGIAGTSARFMEISGPLSKPQLYAQLRANVKQNPLVFGAAMAFEPGAYPGENDLFAPYVCRDGDGFRDVNIDRSVYDWYADPQYTWFTAPKRAGRGIWTDPYFDEGAGNVLMCTYSEPFFRDGSFQGVTTIDLDLTRLRDNVGRAITDGLDFVILTSQGKFVYSPDARLIMTQTIFDVAHQLKRDDLLELGQKITSGTPGISSIEGWDTPQRQWVFYAPIASTGWTFVCRVSERAALAEVRSRMLFAGAALAITLLLIAGCIALISGPIARPISRLTEKVLDLAAGNLDARIDHVRGNDEVAVLARSFNKMTADLRGHVETIATERAERQKIERDLDIAREIQRGLLPSSEPNVKGFDIAGWNKPADKTGGDYYDWQPMPDGRTAISIADATGHGIGPALVTAVCRAYSRASLPSNGNLGTALQHINDLLVDDLTSGRFVTFVAAVVDPAASCLQLLSAGHGPIFFFEAATRKVHRYQADNIPFGIATGVGYGPPANLPMRPGDILLLITDGFFEWANESGEQFGEDRLSDVVTAAAAMPSKELIQRIHAEVLSFAQGTPQQDDLTAVVIKREPA